MRRWSATACALILALAPSARAEDEVDPFAEGEPPAEGEPIPEPEPAPDPDAAPEPEPEADPEPEPEPEAEPEPEPEPDPEPEPEPEPAAPTGASDDPCDTWGRSRPVGPMNVPLYDGSLGTARRGCPRTEIVLGGNAYLVADTAGFYGHIRVNGVLGLSIAVDRDTELFLESEAFRMTSIITAVSSVYLGTGYLTVGGMRRVWTESGGSLAVGGRLLLPTAAGLDQNSQPLGIDAWTTLTWRIDHNLHLFAAADLALVLRLGNGPAEPRGGLRILGGLDWHPEEWFALVVELHAGFGYRFDFLDHLGAGIGVRFGLGSEAALELGAIVPLVGSERGLAGASLRLGWRIH